MPDNLIKSHGTITKEELLTNIEYKIMPGTLVLESSLPFPGYHGTNLPENPAPGMIYLVTNERYDGEDILRAAKKVKKTSNENFTASYGKAIIYPEIYYFIRIRSLSCFDCIPQLQAAFAAEGISFMKKRNIHYEARIQVQKMFLLEKIDEFFYVDQDDPLMYYFEIPDKPDWVSFKQMSIFIRGNIDSYTFDAALGALYYDELKDIIRIYAKDITLDQLHFIRRKYLYELAHPDHLR